MASTDEAKLNELLADVTVSAGSVRSDEPGAPLTAALTRVAAA